MNPLAFYSAMREIRIFEEVAISLYKKGLVGGSYHSGVGQEAVAVGVCGALDSTDMITTTYRGRAQHLAKGIDPFRLFAEILGRSEGCCGGKGGPMHVTELSCGVLGANGIVGGGVPHAAGAALSSLKERSGRVAVTFFGDGAMNQGVVSETFNLAALWSLPVIFVCENNMYAEMTSLEKSSKNTDLAARAKSFGMHAMAVDGNDVREVFRVASETVAGARAGEGPFFVEARTYRLHGHMHGDPETYRSKEEVALWRQRDPLLLEEERLVAESAATTQQLRELDQTILARIEAAAVRAESSPEPDVRAIAEHVY